MVEIRDIYLSAMEISKLENKDFTIAKGGQYKEMPQQGNDPVEKLVLPVKLSNGKIRDWIPNKTSIKTMTGFWESNTDSWIGKQAKFRLTNQNVRGEMKDVIFVESLAPVQKV